MGAAGSSSSICGAYDRSGSHATARFCRAPSWRDGGRGNDLTKPLDDDDDLRLSRREIDDATLWRQPGCPVQLSTEAGASHTSCATPFDTTDRMEPDDARNPAPARTFCETSTRSLCVSVAGPDGRVESGPELHTELVMATRGCSWIPLATRPLSDGGGFRPELHAFAGHPDRSCRRFPRSCTWHRPRSATQGDRAGDGLP